MYDNTETADLHFVITSNNHTKRGLQSSPVSQSAILMIIDFSLKCQGVKQYSFGDNKLNLYISICWLYKDINAIYIAYI